MRQCNLSKVGHSHNIIQGVLIYNRKQKQFFYSLTSDVWLWLLTCNENTQVTTTWRKFLTTEWTLEFRTLSVKVIILSSTLVKYAQVHAQSWQSLYLKKKKKYIKKTTIPGFLFVQQGSFCDEEAFEYSFTGQAWSWHTQRKVSHFSFFSYFFFM